MNFLPDVLVPCEVCHGKRYNRETLEVRYKGKSIADVLDMTINRAVEFFENVPQILNKIKVLQEVGLGTSSWDSLRPLLSGGESQRVNWLPNWPNAIRARQSIFWTSLLPDFILRTSVC